MKKIINSNNAPKPVGAYNQAVLTGNLLFVSGQIPINPMTNELVTDGVKAETIQVMENLKAILKEANMTFENVVKVTIFISDINNFSIINEVYASYFNEQTAPAREMVEVAKLPKLVNVEISMIATTV